MKKSVANFIVVLLLGSAMMLAGLSSDAYGRHAERNSSADQCVEFFADDSGKHNTEFWNKFRESVMPEEKPSSDYTGNDNPEPKNKKPASNN